MCLLTVGSIPAQDVEVRAASPNYMPAPVDSNSPAYWYNGQLAILNSANMPLLSLGFSQFYPMETEAVSVNPFENIPMWIEAAWLDDDGTVYGYYHHEPGGLCPGSLLTSPRIGAVMSSDGGRSWTDLGTVLEAAEPPECTARNGFFAGGHGDFSAVVDHERRYIYFYFSTYGGDVSSQGIAVARLAFSDRYAPAGAVWKYHEGDWTEPGLKGRVTPVMRAKTAWQSETADSFWGPSLHWNHHLESWVMLLNRACCVPRWPQEGIYISYNPDVTNPLGWSAPRMIIDEVGFGPGWYPQVLGTMIGETDKVAGRVARLFIHGVSRWELVFRRADGLAAPPAVQPVVSDPAASTGGDDPAELPDPAEPADSPNPENPPTEPTEPTEPGSPGEPGDTEEPGEPAEPGEPTDPGEPTGSDDAEQPPRRSPAKRRIAR